MSAAHNHHKYHVEMLLADLADLRAKSSAPDYNDTRTYLSLDRVELALVEALLKAELLAIGRTLANIA